MVMMMITMMMMKMMAQDYVSEIWPPAGLLFRIYMSMENHGRMILIWEIP
jgi:hypothetical protein